MRISFVVALFAASTVFLFSPRAIFSQGASESTKSTDIAGSKIISKKFLSTPDGNGGVFKTEQTISNDDKKLIVKKISTRGTTLKTTVTFTANLSDLNSKNVEIVVIGGRGTGVTLWSVKLSCKDGAECVDSNYLIKIGGDPPDSRSSKDQSITLAFPTENEANIVANKIKGLIK